MEIWFNPSCSKCRIARDRLADAGVGTTVRRYLDDPPTETQLRAALAALRLQPWDITRLNEPIAGELGLAEWSRDADTAGDWLRVLVAHPQLLQRPIVLADDGRAWVARDDETLAEVVAAARHRTGLP